MSLGTSYGGSCFNTQLEAANAWCGAYYVPLANGTVFTCNGIVSGASGAAGGAVTFTFARRSVDSGGVVTTSQISGQQLPECETYGYDYHAPALAAFFAAAVAIVAGKRVYKWVFSRESV